MEKKRLHLLFYIVLITVFLVGFVTAESMLDRLLGSNASSSDVLSDFFSGMYFAKFLFFLLVALVVYSLGDFLPFTDRHPNVNIAISIIIAILSTMYMKSEEVYSILLSYSAAGIIITGMIPFFLILAIQKKAYDSGYHYASKFIWLVYIALILIKWLNANVSDLGQFGIWVYPTLAALALGLFIWEHRLFKAMFREEVTDKIDKYIQKKRAARVSTNEAAKDVLNNPDKTGNPYG